MTGIKIKLRTTMVTETTERQDSQNTKNQSIQAISQVIMKRTRSLMSAKATRMSLKEEDSPITTMTTTEAMRVGKTERIILIEVPIRIM